MLPFMTQGAAQAIEDGIALAACGTKGCRQRVDALRGAKITANSARADGVIRRGQLPHQVALLIGGAGADLVETKICAFPRRQWPNQDGPLRPHRGTDSSNMQAAIANNLIETSGCRLPCPHLALNLSL